MKKLLILILALVMCLSVLTSCDQIKGIIDGIIGGEQPEIEYHIDRARSYLNNMYKNENATTAKDYEVVGNVKVAGVDYAVTWATDTDKVTITGPVTKEDGSIVYTVNVDEESATELPYVLTATITAGNGETATVSFNRVVPEKNLFVSVGNPVEGVAYKFFMIQVSEGNKILYADGTTQSNQDKYLNTTQVGKDAPDFFVEKVGEGFKFYYVKDGTNMYIKAYLTTTDHVKYSKCLMYTSNAEEGTVWTYHADTNSWHTDLVQDTLEGDKTVSYVIGTYGTYLTFSISESSYIKPDNTGVSQFPGGLLPKEVAEMDNSTPEEKVAAELAEIKVPSNVKLDGVLDLPLTGSRYPEVTMTWTSNSEYAVVGEDGKITVTIPAEPATIKLSVTVALGEVSETKEFEVELSREATPIADIIALAKTLEDKGATTTDKYIVAGVVVEVKNAQYGNLYIQDAAGNRLYVYGLYDQANVRYDKMENAPQVGDYVVLLSVVGHYNEPQLKNATVLSCVSATTIPEANEIAKTLEDKGPTTEEKYLISGKVVEVANTQYGNLYIEDEAGNKMYVYGLYDEAGNRYDKMPVQPKVGDTITVLSVIGHYNNPQLKNATVVCYTAGTGEEPAHECESVCATCGKCTDAACTESACAEKCEGHEDTPVVPPVTEGSVTFELGANGSAGHVDGNDLGATVTFTEGGNTLVLTGMSKVYGPAFDGKGNSCIKLGTSKVVGTFTFTVDENATSVVIKIARYKNYDNSKVTINGGAEVVLTTNSNDGEYQEIVVDTTTNKTVVLSTVDSNYRAMVNSITLVYGEGGTVTPNPDPVHTCESKCDTCGKCLDAACTESACAEKCEGHAVVHPEGVVDPVVGTAYAFGMVQKNKDNTTYYLKGGMNGYYMETTANVDEALHVYIEETTGGYYLYCMVDGVKTYINCVVSGTHVNGAYEATASTVYTYDADSKTLVADVNGTAYWFGTRNDNTYTTVGPCAVSYKGFYCQFYNIDTTPHEHDYKDVTVEATCTTAGSVTPTCACGAVDEENVKTIAPHSVSGVCSTCGTAIVNVSDLEAGTTTDAELVEGTGISASAGLTIEANGKSIDGFKFTTRLKLGGTMKVSDGVVAAGIKIVVDGPSTITVYAISGSSSETRALRLCTLTDGALVDVMVDETVAGDAIGKYVFTVDAAGTYYLGSKSSGINLYYISVATEKEDVPVVGGGSADFDTIQLPSSKPNGDSSYTGTYTTADGWVTTNSAIQAGGSKDMNPQFVVIGEDNTHKAPCLNGKVGAAGTITSPTLTGGISKLTINYTKMFTDTALAATVTITDLTTGTKYTHTISKTLDKNEKYVVYTEEWVLETPITGDFTIEIVNDCPSGATGNKDRMTILDIIWE